MIKSHPQNSDETYTLSDTSCPPGALRATVWPMAITQRVTAQGFRPSPILERVNRANPDNCVRCGTCGQRFREEAGFKRHWNWNNQGGLSRAVCGDPASFGMTLTQDMIWSLTRDWDIDEHPAPSGWTPKDFPNERKTS